MSVSNCTAATATSYRQRRFRVVGRATCAKVRAACCAVSRALVSQPRASLFTLQPTTSHSKHAPASTPWPSLSLAPRPQRVTAASAAPLVRRVKQPSAGELRRGPPPELGMTASSRPMAVPTTGATRSVRSSCPRPRSGCSRRAAATARRARPMRRRPSPRTTTTAARTRLRARTAPRALMPRRTHRQLPSPPPSPLTFA